VAVATGNYPIDLLRATKADLVLHDFSNPTPFLQMLWPATDTRRN
jgi:hypothetical protein